MEFQEYVAKLYKSNIIFGIFKQRYKGNIPGLVDLEKVGMHMEREGLLLKSPHGHGFNVERIIKENGDYRVVLFHPCGGEIEKKYSEVMSWKMDGM